MQAPTKTLNMVLAINKHLKVTSNISMTIVSIYDIYIYNAGLEGGTWGGGRGGCRIHNLCLLEHSNIAD